MLHRHIVLSQEMKVKDMTNIVIEAVVDNVDYLVKTENGEYNMKCDISTCSCSSFVTTGLICQHMICVAPHAGVNLDVQHCTHKR